MKISLRKTSLKYSWFYSANLLTAAILLIFLLWSIVLAYYTIATFYEVQNSQAIYTAGLITILSSGFLGYYFGWKRSKGVVSVTSRQLQAYKYLWPYLGHLLATVMYYLVTYLVVVFG